MIVFILVFLSTMVYFIRYLNSIHKKKIEPCKIHKWISINNIMFCEICRYCPKLKEWYGDSN